MSLRNILYESLKRKPGFSDPPAQTAACGNPFLRGGSSRTKTKEDDAAYHFSVDMPGVPDDGAKVWVDNGALIVEGAEPPEEATGRKYGSSYELPVSPHKFDEMKVGTKDGILRVAIPKLKRVLHCKLEKGPHNKLET
ncbi:hypothetical protein RJ640_012874 [Escallonia rubra]|uniref:SHSP domain-containing protein n=1 Tax=Escallonia rubra TaxID=112253 RepID=A0AA88R5B7_9ASTE|nr:hypothetical protein RJ640_012874 [Escallonia rubra]